MILNKILHLIYLIFITAIEYSHHAGCRQGSACSQGASCGYNPAACHPCSFNDCWLIASGNGSFAFSYTGQGGWCRFCDKNQVAANIQAVGWGIYVRDDGKCDIIS